MSKVLKGLINQKCMIYLDNILVMGWTFTEHLENLREVLQSLREANLCLKLRKCHLAKQQVLYLGYVITEAKISVGNSKVEAIQKFPIPRNVKELRSFLGLALYYRRFIEGFSKIAGHY